MKKTIVILMTTLIFISQPIKAEEINIDPQMKKLSMLTKKPLCDKINKLFPLIIGVKLDSIFCFQFKKPVLELIE